MYNGQENFNFMFIWRTAVYSGIRDSLRLESCTCGNLWSNRFYSDLLSPTSKVEYMATCSDSDRSSHIDCLDNPVYFLLKVPKRRYCFIKTLMKQSLFFAILSVLALLLAGCREEVDAPLSSTWLKTPHPTSPKLITPHLSSDQVVTKRSTKSLLISLPANWRCNATTAGSCRSRPPWGSPMFQRPAVAPPPMQRQKRPAFTSL